MSSAHARHLPALPRQHKYKVLLGLLLVSIVIQTYGLHSGFAGVLSDIFRTFLVVTIFLVVFRGTRERLPAALLCYCSFAQMTRLGYGDVTSVRAPATTLSLFAALFGMFCTAIVVAQFVGLAQGAPGLTASAHGKGKQPT